MGFWGRTGHIITAAFLAVALQSLAQAAPEAAQNPPPAPAPSGAAATGFVPPRAVASSVMKNWPAYPPVARLAHREGVVLLSVKISAEGAPLDVKLAKSSGFTDLDAAAIAAVRNWQFTPAMRDGAAVEVSVNLPINFSLKTAAPPAAASAGAPKPAPAAEKPKPKPKAAPKPAPKPKPKPEAPKPDAAPAAAGPEEPAKEAN